MSLNKIAAALGRVQDVVERRPEAGLHDDATALAHWDGGTRVVCSHANGTQVVTDVPCELGGSGDQVSPGWMLRAGVASCALTCIVLDAARAGVALRTLDVTVGSRSAVRGVLHLAEADGTPVHAGPRDVAVRVHVAADGIDDASLRTLVETACRGSPMSMALSRAVRLALDIAVTAPAEAA